LEEEAKYDLQLAFLEKFNQELRAAAQIVADRMPTHGIPEKDFEYHTDWARLKIKRARTLQTRNKEKIIDDLRDAINYCVFAILSLEE